MVSITVEPLVHMAAVIFHSEDAGRESSDNVNVALLVELDVLETTVRALRCFGEVKSVVLILCRRVP
jgi:hypothetical protein